MGIGTTGSEISKGLIQDTFGPVIEEKLGEFPTTVMGQVYPGDDKEKITEEILSFIEQGADMVVCTGGMSVDPDDRTPLAIRNTTDEVVTYGAPVLPGAMFMLAYKYREDGSLLPVLGLPGCVMYAKRTIFDLALPRIAAGEKLTEKDFTQMGEGGLCLSCTTCTFPDCGFGK